MTTQNTAPTLVSQPTVCAMLSLSRNGLHKLQQRDSSFPKPLKDGSSRQARAYYVLAEVESWLAARIATRDAGDMQAQPAKLQSSANPY